MKNIKTTRFAVSLREELLENFDRITRERGYTNRSQAVQDLIKNYLIEQEWDDRENAMGTITLVYDHHKRNLSGNLTTIQHRYHAEIISNMHVHLDLDNCLEVIAVKGQGQVIRKLADELISSKGVIHGKLTLTATGK